MSLRERKAAQKREDIIHAATLVFTEKGYNGTTMEDIAAKLLMTKGSVYYYFKDKQELLYQCQKMLLKKSIQHVRIIQDKNLPTVDTLLETMKIHIEYLISERTGFETLIDIDQYLSTSQQSEILALRDDYGKHIDKLIAKGVNEGIFVPSDVKIVRNIILGAMNWVIQWYSPDGEKSESEIAEMIADYLMRILIKDSYKKK